MDPIGQSQQSATAPTSAPLRDSKWAMWFFQYLPGHRSAFWMFVKKNSIPRIKLGRRVFFDESAVVRWVATKGIARSVATKRSTRSR
jgi:hypothetical protein